MGTDKYWVTVDDSISRTQMRVLVVPNIRRRRVSLFVRHQYIEVRIPESMCDSVWRTFLPENWQEMYAAQKAHVGYPTGLEYPDYCWIRGHKHVCRIFVDQSEDYIEWVGQELRIRVTQIDRCLPLWREWRFGQSIEELVAVFDRAAAHGRSFGLCPRLVRIKDLRASWGVCHARGDIHLAAALWSVPPRLALFVVHHELCHLKHMNHSPQFYQQLAQLEPDYAQLARELEAFGHVLRSGLE